MKRINIFKPGRHTAASGTTLEFTEDQLRAAVEAYDPALHEAPIVVGHPKDNHPAYGWVGSMEYSEDAGVDAIPQQVDADFAELVTAGRFKKVSASWYTPDSPANPKPGSYYLRHVGFLGAQPPAIKGLKAVEFNEAEEGVVEFSGAWDTQTTAGIFRRLREFLIDKFSKEEADGVIPDYAITDLEQSARNQIDEQIAADPDFTEETPTELEDNAMTLEELQAKNAEQAARIAELEGQAASFSEREQDLAKREKAARRKELEAFADAEVKAGRLLPAQKDNLVNFMEQLPAEQTVDFQEGDGKKALPLLDAFKAFIGAQPSKVEFGERAGDDHTRVDMTPEQLAQKATAYKAKVKRDEGRVISFSEAVDAVENGLA